MSDLLSRFLGPDPSYHLAVEVGLVMLVVGVLLRAGAPAGRSRRVAGLVAILVAASLLGITFAIKAATKERWGYIIALMPGLLIGRQAVYMRLVRRQGLLTSRHPHTDVNAPPGVSQAEWTRLQPVLERAQGAHDREFSADVLSIRYGVPAILSVIIGFGLFQLLQSSVFGADLERGARYAAAGSYVYVLSYLGQRSFRRDITSGAATWSVVTLALGPLLGGVLALLWRGQSGGATDASPWTYNTIYFVAGLAPRYAASVVEEAVRRLWLPKSSAAVSIPRTEALTKIRGITPEIEERLAEEGITDTNMLSMANPIKLYRNTSFDKRQILSWIDEALLITMLPDAWEKLQKQGISGASDLASLQTHIDASGSTVSADLKALIGIDSPTMVRDLILRAYEDSQVALVWALYQSDDDGAEVDGDDERDPVRARLRSPEASQTASSNGDDTWWLWVTPTAFVLGAVLLWTWGKTWPIGDVDKKVLPSLFFGGIGLVIAGLKELLPWDQRKVQWRYVIGGLALVGLAAIVHWDVVKVSSAPSDVAPWLAAIAAGFVAYAVATIPLRRQKEKASTGVVAISTKPADARVSISPAAVPETRLRHGKYVVSAAAPGYFDETKDIVVNDQSAPVDMVLKSRPTTLTVVVSPAGAPDPKLWIDGVQQAALTVNVEPGLRTLRLTATGYSDASLNVYVAAAQNTTIDWTLVKP